MQGALHVTHPDLFHTVKQWKHSRSTLSKLHFPHWQPPKKQQHSNSLYTAKVAAHGVAAR